MSQHKKLLPPALPREFSLVLLLLREVVRGGEAWRDLQWGVEPDRTTAMGGDTLPLGYALLLYGSRLRLCSLVTVLCWGFGVALSPWEEDLLPFLLT